MGSSEKERTSIEGILLMLDDKTPHVAVPVQAIRDGKAIATTLSDIAGEYRFVNLESGLHQLRCHVLDGYIYYQTTDESLVITHHEELSTAGNYAGTILSVEHGQILKNIDLRFAHFKKGTWKRHTTLDGLAGNDVKVIYQDADSAMWFGTTNGVSRYDEQGWTTFTNHDGLPNNDVASILQDADGAMWFATLGGISRYDGQSFVNFTTEDGLADNHARILHLSPDGALWIGTENGVSRYDGGKFVNFTTEDGLASNVVTAIQSEPDGTLWFGTGIWWLANGKGISRYNKGEFVSFTAEDGLAGDTVSAIHRGSDGTLWFGTNNGISRYDGNEFVNLTAEDGLLPDSGSSRSIIYSIYRDPDGVLWFGTQYGVSRYDGKTIVHFISNIDESNIHQVSAIHRTDDGSMWFGTSNGGVCQYDSKTLISFTERDGLASSFVWNIHQDSNRDLWLTTSWSRKGIYRYDGNRFVNFDEQDGLRGSLIQAVHEDSDGVLWFGGELSGLSRYDGNSFITFTTKDGLPGNNVVAIQSAPDGTLWLGAHPGGLCRYDGKTFASFTERDGFVGNSVLSIYRALDDVMWVGTQESGLFRYDGKKFEKFTTAHGLVGNGVYAIHQDGDGVLWFGMTSWNSDGRGLCRYDGKEFTTFTTRDGMMHNSVWCMHRDTDGILWIGTVGGVCGYDGTSWTSLDARDGLDVSKIRAIHQDTEGYLWLGPDIGPLIRYRRRESRPLVRIISVKIGQETYTDLPSIPPITVDSRITIAYSALDFKTIPEKRQYRFRIREIDSSWRQPTKSNIADLIFDDQGTYTFEVQAIDRDLNYSEPASVKLEVIPDPRNHRIAQLEGELAERERAELERVYRELEDARQIQQSLLPDRPPEIEGFEIAGTSLPAKEVSGDFYSYLSLGDNTGIVLADVTGKSVKAAMVAALTNGTLNAEIEDRKDIWGSPAGILRRLNVRLQPHLIRGMYTAMSLGIVQPERKRLIFSNAGMPYPVVKRGREVWELEVNGMPLGLMDKVEYQDLTFEMEEGDMVVFYSDGVIEAENEAGEMYQTERLLELIQGASAALSAQEMVDLIVSDVTSFAGDEETSDDITIVVLRCME